MERITRPKDRKTNALARGHFSQLAQLHGIARDHGLAIMIEHCDLQRLSTARLKQPSGLLWSTRDRRHLARGLQGLQRNRTLADHLEAGLEGVRASHGQRSQFP